MSAHTKRTAVYLTPIQRELVRAALTGLSKNLQSSCKSLGWESVLADSFTVRRIDETAKLFNEPPAAKAGMGGDHE